MSLALLPGKIPRRILRFLRMDRRRRALLLRAWVLLWKHRIRLWSGPFRIPEASEAPQSPSPSGAEDGSPDAAGASTGGPHGGPGPSSRVHRPSPGAIGWAVAAASRLVPGSTCLVQALAAHSLCRRFGYASALRLGARRDSDGDLEAHAWLEMGEEVVVGGSQELSDYSLFTAATEEPRDEAAPEP